MILIHNFAELKRKSTEEDNDPWNYYFNTEFISFKTEHCQNCNLNSANGQYYLDECNLFDDNDRVINFSPVFNTLFLHNRCSFSHCTSTKDGSCVYYQVGANSAIVQRKFCCTKCRSSNYGQFSYTNFGTDNLNFFIESSLFDVGNESVGEKTIHASNGNIIVSSTNFSSNKATKYSAGYIYKSLENDFITTFNYSTVVNNLVTGSRASVLYIRYNSLIDSCNIINNTNRQSTIGIIYHYKNSLTVKSCSFINNTILEGSCLIYNTQDQLTVDSCYIDNSISTTFRNDVTPTNSRGPFTNNLTHFSTGNCQAEFAIINKSKSVEYCYHKILRRR